MRLDAVLCAHHEVGEMRDVVDIIIADIRDLVLTAGHLPNLLPDVLDLEIVELPLPVAVSRYPRSTAGHRTGESQRVRHAFRLAVVLQKDVGLGEGVRA